MQDLRQEAQQSLRHVLPPVLHQVRHQSNGRHARIVKVGQGGVLTVNKLVGVALEQFHVVGGEAYGGEAHLVQQKVHVRLEHLVGGRQFHGQVHKGQAQVNDPIGAELTGRTEVERLAHRPEELGGDVLRKVPREFLALVLGVAGDAVPRKQAGHDLHRPLLGLPPRPRVALLGGGGLTPGFQPRVGLGEGLGQDGRQDVEPRLKYLRIRQGGGRRPGSVLGRPSPR
mmetsp:Transcript_33800/g.100809  ORF Transcript_33800/g.100809 Transcript_33800/m.100809 type:complete len:227 (-) Transcript_33800:1398-2078(-)